MDDSLAGGFRIGDHAIQPRQGRIVSFEGEVHVEPRAMDVLVALARRAGDTVSRDELIEAVWKHPHVSDEALTRCISLLRQALADDRARPRYLETIPKRGYRLMAPVEINGVHRDSHPGGAAPRDRSKTNPGLPLQLTSFVGRERELGEVAQRLQESRLVTLVGFGGIGKTRLSLQVAAQRGAGYADGVRFVELESLVDARLVPQAVAMALGVREEPGRPVLEALLARLDGAQLLLVLDNCEHLLDACAQLVEQLLQSTPLVTILASSRERLNVAGETVYPVPALTMSPSNERVQAARLEGYEAVRLFVDRAVEVQSAFRLSDANAAAVADICRRVDGIPLAIELAAARMRTGSPEQIAERLNDRFRLLRHGDPTTAPRQQTLRALIDWSYDLLSGPERALLRRVAVFAGGWTLEAAESVGAGAGVDAIDVIDLLCDLVEKSLVVFDDARKRYRLLDSVRQYAREKLDQSGEEEETLGRHGACYLAFAEAAKQELSGAEQQEWFTRVDLERENLLAVHAWCGRFEEKSESRLKLVDALRTYWIHRGGLELGHRLTVEALSSGAAQQRTPARVGALVSAAVLESCMGNYAEALKYAETALSIARELGDDDSVRKACRIAGEQLLAQGRMSEALRYEEESVAVGRRLHGPALLDDLTSLAELHRLEGRLDVAEALLEESLALSRQFEIPRSAIVNLLNLASISIARGHHERPPALLFEALADVERTGSKPLGAMVLLISAASAASTGDWRRTAQLHAAANAQMTQLGYRVERGDEEFLSPFVAEARKSLGDAAFEGAATEGRASSYETALKEVSAWLQERVSASRNGSP